jgi:hypothetical protein
MAWTAPRTWVASELVTASLLNTHVRDNALHLSKFYGCMVRLTSNQSIGATTTALLSWDATVYEVGDDFWAIGSPTILQATFANFAYVEILASVQWESSGNQRRELRIVNSDSSDFQGQAMQQVEEDWFGDEPDVMQIQSGPIAVGGTPDQWAIEVHNEESSSKNIIAGNHTWAAIIGIESQHIGGTVDNLLLESGTTDDLLLESGVSDVLILE